MFYAGQAKAQAVQEGFVLVSQKESNREAFESWFEPRYDANFMQFALDLGFYVDKHTQTSWEAWQAAKAQVVHECTWMGAYDCSVFESSCGHTFE